MDMLLTIFDSSNLNQLYKTYILNILDKNMHLCTVYNSCLLHGVISTNRMTAVFVRGVLFIISSIQHQTNFLLLINQTNVKI